MVAFLPVTLEGSPAGDGSELSGLGTFLVPGHDEQGPFHATLCGNGNLDAGEACDDGAVTGGCCTDACTPKPDGVSCTSTAACQIAPSCSAGACVGTPKPAGTDGEADGNRCTDDACDGAGSCVMGPCSPCCGGPQCTSAPRFSCKGSTDVRDLIDIEKKPDDARDRIIWRIPRLEATSLADLPDPATTDYAVCFYTINSVDDFALYFDAVAPAGLGCGRKRCWTQSPTGGVAYNGGRLKPDGVASLRVKPGADGRARLSFIGRGPNLNLTNPLFIFGGSLLVELHAGDACFGARYFNLGERPDIRTSTRYRKKGSE